MNQDVLTTLAIIVVPGTLGCLSCPKKSSVATSYGWPSIFVNTISGRKILFVLSSFFPNLQQEFAKKIQGDLTDGPDIMSNDI